MSRVVVSGFGLFLLLLVHAEAYTTNGSTLTVTNCADQTDLQNAINAAPTGGTVTFACGTPSSPATIPITTSLTAGGQSFTLEGNGSVILSGVGSPGTILNLAGATATVRDITITGGTGSQTGGGIKVVVTPVTVINATIYNNAATGAGGRGGGIQVLGGATLTVINSTFSGNSATQLGNDLENDGPSNVVNLVNSIFLDGCGVNGGTFTDGGGNIDTGTSCIANNTHGSLVNVNTTILGPLINNLYFTVPFGSVALALDSSNCPARDQLGNTRGSTCNAGSIQITPPPPPPATPVPSSLWLALAGLLIYSIWPSRIRTVRCP